LEECAALGQREGLLHRGTWAEKVPDFVDGGAKRHGTVDGLES
jgi:hypothetical protein